MGVSLWLSLRGVGRGVVPRDGKKDSRKRAGAQAPKTTCRLADLRPGDLGRSAVATSTSREETRPPRGDWHPQAAGAKKKTREHFQRTAQRRTACIRLNRAHLAYHRLAPEIKEKPEGDAHFWKKFVFLALLQVAGPRPIPEARGTPRGGSNRAPGPGGAAAPKSRGLLFGKTNLAART